MTAPAAAHAGNDSRRPVNQAPGLRTVPYSTYQPGSTCTVIASWLVTKEQRKHKRKMEKGRPTLTMVANDDLW